LSRVLAATLEDETDIASAELGDIDIRGFAELEDAVGVVAAGLGEVASWPRPR